MKTLHTIVNRYAGIGGGLFGFFLLMPYTLFAQTFTGRDYLAESPVSVRAFIYPDAHKTALKIRLENRTSNAVHVRIVNAEQKTVYDDYVTKPRYYGRLDLSALPYGSYTIELVNRAARHRQAFRIEQLKAERIVMITQPMERDSLLAKH